MAERSINEVMIERIKARASRMANERPHTLDKVSIREFSSAVRKMGDLPLEGRETQYWLLKDDDRKTVAAMQLDDGELIVFTPEIELLDRALTDKYIIPFLKEISVGYEEHLDANGYLSGSLGYLIDTKGGWHHVSELPDGLTINGNLQLAHWKQKDLPKALPNNMTITGELRIGASFKTLPENLTVGELVIEGNSLKSFPKGLTVENDLIFDEDSITEFPDDMTVQGKLAKDGLPKPDNAQYVWGIKVSG